MKKTILTTSYLVFCGFVFGQTSMNTSGGGTSNASGSISYSIGQVAYQSISNTSGSVSQGVQHTFEISTLSLEDNKFNFTLNAFPNPTSDVLHIEVGDVKALDGYRYRIVDALGKELYNELVKNAITGIPMKTLGAAGMYQFEVLDQKNVRIQTNKIVLQ